MYRILDEKKQPMVGFGLTKTNDPVDMYDCDSCQEMSSHCSSVSVSDPIAAAILMPLVDLPPSFRPAGSMADHPVTGHAEDPILFGVAVVTPYPFTWQSHDGRSSPTLGESWAKCLVLFLLLHFSSFTQSNNLHKSILNKSICISRPPFS